MLATLSVSAQGMDLAFSLGEDNTIDITTSILEEGATLSTVEIWISSFYWDETSAMISASDPNAYAPYLQSRTFELDSLLGEGSVQTINIPAEWVQLMEHGIFDTQENMVVMGLIGINGINWMESLDYPEDVIADSFGDSYVGFYADVVSNVEVVAEETIVIVTDCVSNNEEVLATVDFPTVVNQDGTLSFNHNGVVSFQFAVVWPNALHIFLSAKADKF